MPAPGRRWQAALIVVLFFVAVAAAAFTGWWYARESPPHQGPIVLISADNLAANRLTPYGGSGPGHTRDRCPRHRRCGVRSRVRALASDAAVARLDSLRPAALRARRSRRCRLCDEGRCADARRAAAETAASTPAPRSRPSCCGPSPASRKASRSSTPNCRSTRTATCRRPRATRRRRLKRRSAGCARRMTSAILLFVQVDEAGGRRGRGRVVQELKDRDLYDEATIFLVGDHGDEQAVPSLADTSLHVPLIVKQPDSEGAGRRVVAPVQHIDLLPTILDLVRAPIPSGIRGRSLRSVLDDEDATVPEQPIYAESLAAHFRLGGHAVYGLTSGARRLDSRRARRALRPRDRRAVAAARHGGRHAAARGARSARGRAAAFREAASNRTSRRGRALRRSDTCPTSGWCRQRRWPSSRTCRQS